MKPIRQKTIGGVEIPILVYESVEEGDRAAGRQGAVLDECNKNLVYRGTLALARSLVASVVEKVTGVKREQRPILRKQKQEDGTIVEVPATDKEGNELTEPTQSEQEFVEFAMAKAGMSAAQLQPYIEEAAANYENTDDDNNVTSKGFMVDISERIRKAPQPKTLAAKFVSAAEKALANPDKLKKFTKDYEKEVGEPLDYSGENGQPDATKLGWAIKRFAQKLEEKLTGGF